MEIDAKILDAWKLLSAAKDEEVYNQLEKKINALGFVIQSNKDDKEKREWIKVVRDYLDEVEKNIENNECMVGMSFKLKREEK